MPIGRIKRIILATTNKGKLKEFKASLLADSACLQDSKNKIDFASIDAILGEDKDFDIEETGKTFMENAIIKAKAGAALTHEFCLADDSGIEIDALGGRPGIYSGRYLKCEDLKNYQKQYDELVKKYLQTGKSENYALGVYRVLEEMRGKSNRACRFVCTLAIASPNGEIVFETKRTWEGLLTELPRGNNGFGYDPIVVPSNLPDKYKNLFGKTVAELDSEIKNKLSHRAQAIKDLKVFLENCS